MSIEQFQLRIKALPPGETALLTQPQFEAVFASGVTAEERKQLAILLAEENVCSVRFIGLEECYAAFTKKQNRIE